MTSKPRRLEKLASILFDDDPLVNKIVSLSYSAAEKISDISQADDEQENTDTKNDFDVNDQPKNSFLKLLLKFKNDSKEFEEKTEQSLEWYKKKIGNEIEGEVNPLETYETQRTGVLRFPGQLITFKYDPKYKFSLPYYDVFPLVLTLDVNSTGFLGLNFHYLKPIERAIFMDALYKYQSTKYFQKIIRIKYTQLLKNDSLRYYRPCIKRYLYKNMSQNMAIISPHLWDAALFLPSEKWMSHTNEEGFTKTKVWDKSHTLTRKK